MSDRGFAASRVSGVPFRPTRRQLFTGLIGMMILALVAVGGMVPAGSAFDRAGTISVEHVQARQDRARAVERERSAARGGEPTGSRPVSSSPSASGRGGVESSGEVDEAGPAPSRPKREPTRAQQREFFDRLDPQLDFMIAECHENVADDGLSGELRLSFDVVYDDEAAGVAVEAELMDDSEIREPEFVDCVMESVKSVELPAAEGFDRLQLTTVHRFPLDE